MICRTPDEAFQAGWDDTAGCEPLSQEQADYVAAVLASAPAPETRAA